MSIDEAIEKHRRIAETKKTLYDACILEEYNRHLLREYKEHEQLAEWLEELKMYRKLEEQGLLLRLPCKAGSTVYKIITQRDNFDDRAYKIVSAIEFRISMIDEIGKTVFLTKEEAEQKLKEIKGNGE